MEEIEAVLETGGAAAAELVGSAFSARDCPNCSEPLTGRFCASCGQPADAHRRSVGHLTRDLVKDIASFDSRILRTVKALLFQPGELAKAFREGRTQRYVPPVRLYLFVSLFFFLILSATNVAIFQFVMTAIPGQVTVDHGRAYLLGPNGERAPVPIDYADGKTHYTFNSKIVFFARHGSVHSEMTEDARRRLGEGFARAAAKEKADHGKSGVVTRTVMATLAKLAQDPAALNGSLTAWIPRALFLLLPLFALLVAAFYWRQRKSLYFVDHLVFSLGCHSFAFVLLLLAAGCAQFLPGEAVLWGAIAVLGGYALLAMKRFYDQNWFWTGAKFAAVSLLYVVFFVLPAFGGVIAASVMWD